MNKKPTLYIIQGFIASGKTTFSRKLAEETGATHFNPDEQIKELFPKDEYMSKWDKCFEYTTNFLWSKTKELLKNGQDVIFDMGFWLRKDRDYAREIALQCNADCKHYYLHVPDDVLKQRIVKNRPKNWVKIHLDNFEKNKKLFEMPTEEDNVIMINNY